jgi:hypothetical protein
MDRTSERQVERMTKQAEHTTVLEGKPARRPAATTPRPVEASQQAAPAERTDRRGLLKAALGVAAAVGAVGAGAVLEARPSVALADSPGSFNSANPAVPAVSAAGTNGADGVFGTSDTGVGLLGTSGGSGVLGEGSPGVQGVVTGEAPLGAPVPVGIYGFGGVNATGVIGVGSPGLQGVANSATPLATPAPTGVYGIGGATGIGVNGVSYANGQATGTGVLGASDQGVGVSGISVNTGVLGEGNPGVQGVIYGGAALKAAANAAIYGVGGGSANGSGVVGDATNSAGTGVLGLSTQGIGVHASSTNGPALQVDGRLTITGASVGQATIPAGASSVKVSSSAATAVSLVLLTPLGNPHAFLWVSARAAGSFTIKASAALAAALTVQYLIVN